MSKALSASVTFEALENRVDVLEAGSAALAGAAFTGNVTFGDANFGAFYNAGAQPFVSFDSGDSLSYVRSSNTFAFNISSVPVLSITAANAAFAGSVNFSNDANFSAQIVTSNPRITCDTGDYLYYDRSLNRYNFVVGSAVKAYIGSNGDFASTGAIYVNTDNNFSLDIPSGNPTINLDSGDKIYFNRSANKFYFYIGGVNVASIDASGNMKLLGTLTQSTTP